MRVFDPLLAPIPGADHREIGGVQLDIMPAGQARVKRTIYKVGFRWDSDMKPLVGTDYCLHAHVGMLVQGHIQLRFADGCVRDFTAPCAVVVEPGHEGWVVGDTQAVLIEVDFLGDTAARFGLNPYHEHRC
jgi:hypothetical protein